MSKREFKIFSTMTDITMNAQIYIYPYIMNVLYFIVLCLLVKYSASLLHF